MSTAFSFLVVLTGGALFMLLLYLVQRRTLDAGIVDAGWASGVGLAALWHAWTGAGTEAHRAALVLVALPWSLRLATYILLNRVVSDSEDGRYRGLRARWGKHAQRNFFLLFQAQTLLIAAFSLPMFVVANTTSAPTGFVLVLGVLWGWGSLAGEALADRQLSRWRKNPENRGKTCTTGLWRYSRHPNYFFEWMHWWAYVFLAAGSPAVWITLAGPVLMFVFLYRVTGIPYTEQQALLSRGEDYRDYQRRTSAFVPWPPAKP